MASDGEPADEGGPQLGPIAQFALKTLIAAVIGVLSLAIVTEMAVSSLDDMMRRNMELALLRVDNLVRSNVQSITNDVRNATSGGQTVARMERALEWVSSPATELTPEKKQKLLAELRIVSERWRPIIAEALAIVAMPEKGETAAPK